MQAEDAIEIEFIGGRCPVQSEGRIGGQPFYFRARWQHWYIGIGGSDPWDSPQWFHEEPYGNGAHDAGYMTVDEARALIVREARRYLANEPSDVAHS